MSEANGHPIGRLVSWTERPRHGNMAPTSWRGHITEIKGPRAREELISPCTGWAYPLIEELIDEETGRPLSLQPPSLPLPHTPGGPGGEAPRVWKPQPIDWDDLKARLGLSDEAPREPRFHVPTTPIVSPSKPLRDRTGSNIDAARAWLRARAPAVSGQGGRPHTYATVCTVMFGFELNEHDTLMLVSEWNAWCKPPWQPHEFAAIVRHAAQHGSKYEPGFMLRGRRRRKPRAARERRKNNPFEGMTFQFGDSSDGAVG